MAKACGRRGRRRRGGRSAGLAALLLALPAAGSPTPGAAQERPRPPGAVEDAEGVQPGSELRVWLVTFGPGAAVWERFGHNAIRVLDTSTGRDVSYSWGIFDFDQADFIPRFLRGEMLYSMYPFPTRGMIASYAQAGRETILQELDLSPAERRNLRDYVEFNARPENRDYYYDYFLDNCSTRVRDVLDTVLAGALSARFRDEPTGTTWRYHIRRLTEVDPWLYTGMDVLLGTPGDEPISLWEEMFVPMTLRDAVRRVSRAGPDGSLRPLVMSEDTVVVGAFPPEPDRPPGWLGWYAVIGLGIGALLVLAAAWNGRAFAIAAGAWSLVCGVVGTILFLVLFTDHQFMAWNLNLLLFNPLWLGVLAGLAAGGWRASRPGRADRAEEADRAVGAAGSEGASTPWVQRLAWGLVGLAVAGLLWELLPVPDQQNAIFLALAIPAHVGVAVGLERQGAWRRDRVGG